MAATGVLPAVVLGGAVNALSIARSLGRRGVPVDVLAHEGEPLAVRASRFCRRYVAMPAPVQDRWLDWLLDARVCEPSALLPAGDEGVELVACNREALSARSHRPFEGEDRVTLAMLDKAQTYELAAELGVPAPRAHLLERPDDVPDAAGAVDYPAVLKPRTSHVYLRAFPPEGKGRIVSSPAEMTAVASPILEAGVALVLVDLVPGPHDAFCSYYTYLDEEGEPLVHVTKRKLRQHPVRFGEGTYHQMAWEPEAAELGLRFLRGVGLRGLANVEFKRDGRDGRLKLIECNPRFTQADVLLRRAGIDLPLLAYSRLAGRPTTACGRQRDGLHLWFPRRDLRALRDLRRADELSTTRWLRSLVGRQVPPCFDPGDPAPSFHGVRRRLEALRRTLRPGRVHAEEER